MSIRGGYRLRRSKRGKNRRNRNPATEAPVSRAAPPGAMTHPPPDAPPGPASWGATVPDGEATNAWVSPDAVVPDPATCPGSFRVAASVAVHPGKKRIA
jgi:hypothetical protein